MIKTPNVSSQKNLAKVSVKIENGVADLSNVMFLESLDHRPTVSTDIYELLLFVEGYEGKVWKQEVTISY